MFLITISKWNHFRMYLLDSKCRLKRCILQCAYIQRPSKFQWKETIYKFLGTPNGYSEEMRIFYENSKTPFQYCKKKSCCWSHLLMTHIYKVQQKRCVIKTLMQQ